MNPPLTFHNAKAIEPRRSPKWHRVYLLLALFNVLVILLSMFVRSSRRVR